MRVALVNPYAESLSWFFYSQGMATPPVGLVQVATALVRAGHAVQAIDGQASYEEHEVTVRRVLATDPELVGIGTTPLVHLYSFMSTTATPYWLDFATRLRAAGYTGRTLIGGTYATRFPRLVLDACTALDGVVVGAGDESLRRYAADPSAGPHPGIVTREHPAGPALSLGDALTTPDYSLLDGWPHAYGVDEDLFLGPGPRRMRPVVPLLTARGCPHRCSFCPTPVFFDDGFEEAGLDATLDHLVREVSNHGVRAVSLWDDTFTVSPRRVRAVCEGIIARRLDVRWWCFGRSEWVDRHRELVPLMVQAGLRMMWLGVESSDRAVLASYNRRTPFDLTRDVVTFLVSEGVLPTTSFIFGDADATRVALLLELQRAGELYELGSVNVFTLMIPLPGTPLHARLSQEGRLASADLRLYGGTRAVVRYPDMGPGEVEDRFYTAYRDSILADRFLKSVGRVNIWDRADQQRPAEWSLDDGFLQEVAKMRALDASPARLLGRAVGS